MQTPLDIGVDVAKDTVVVACASHALAAGTIKNERAALLAFVRSLPHGSRIGLEATGSYHELLANLAVKAGFTVFLLNPRDTRHYAQGVGLRAKTDRVDAALMARLVAREHDRLHPYSPPSVAQRSLQRLLKRRAKLTCVKGTLRQSLSGLTGFAGECQRLLERIDRLIALIDRRMRELIRQDPQAAPACTRLRTIVGVGPLVGAGLISALARTPFKNADAFVAFTGLDPRADDSGKRAGRRRLSKRGPAELRRLLYNAAMSAAKTKTWQPLYARCRERGLPSTAALIIIARKIARTDWSIYHHNTTFSPERLTKNA